MGKMYPALFVGSELMCKVCCLLIGGMALVVAGCSTVDVNVGSFSTLPDGGSPGCWLCWGTPRKLKSRRSLQVQDSPGVHFAEQGFAITDDIYRADYVAFVNYGMDDGQTITTLLYEPGLWHGY